MGVKSVLEIDVNDSKFAKFLESYQKYEAALAKMPTAWAEASKEQSGIAKNFREMTAALMAQNELASENDDGDKKRLARLTTSERMWTSMSKSAASISKSVLDVGTGLIKWSSLIGAGLLGGSLFGIDRMARDVSNSRRSAMGLGVSPGEQKAFGLDFGRLVDPNFLEQVADMKSDPSKSGPLFTMGVGTGGSTADTAIALMNAMRQKALATPVEQLGLLDAQTGLNEGTETWRRMKSMKDPEYKALMAQFGQDRKGLGYSDDVARQWTNLTQQLERAGASIFKTFVVGLVPLEKPLAHLSESFTKFANTLLKSDLAKDAITNVGNWLESFSGTIAKPEFLTKVQQFTSDIGGLADVIHKAVHPADTVGGWLHNTWLGNLLGVQQDKDFKAGDVGKYNQYLSALDFTHGLPQGLLERQKLAESGNSMNPADSKKGARGVFQFMPDTARQYGIDPSSPEQAGRGAADYDSYLFNKYDRDITKALAAYNWGPQNLDKDIGAHGKDWLKYAPKETQDYVRKVSGINIVVTNNTGGSAQVSVNALAAGS